MVRLNIHRCYGEYLRCHKIDDLVVLRCSFEKLSGYDPIGSALRNLASEDTLPDCVLEIIHDIDSRARGQMAVHEKVTSTDDRNRYIIISLIEEAVTSSQLEGAATTRKVAVDMLRSGRATKANK